MKTDKQVGDAICDLLNDNKVEMEAAVKILLNVLNSVRVYAKKDDAEFWAYIMTCIIIKRVPVMDDVKNQLNG